MLNSLTVNQNQMLSYYDVWRSRVQTNHLRRNCFFSSSYSPAREPLKVPIGKVLNSQEGGNTRYVNTGLEEWRVMMKTIINLHVLFLKPWKEKSIYIVRKPYLIFACEVEKVTVVEIINSTSKYSVRVALLRYKLFIALPCILRNTNINPVLQEL